MSHGTRRALAVIALGLFATGCAGTDRGADPGAPAEGPTASPAETPAETPGATPSASADGAVPEDLLDEAVAVAVERTGVSAEQVEVVRAEDVQWRSSALGCPKEGQMYTQVVTEGYWVVVRAGDTELDLRAADGGRLLLCEGGGEPRMGAGGP